MRKLLFGALIHISFFMVQDVVSYLKISIQVFRGELELFLNDLSFVLLDNWFIVLRRFVHLAY